MLRQLGTIRHILKGLDLNTIYLVMMSYLLMVLGSGQGDLMLRHGEAAAGNGHVILFGISDASVHHSASGNGKRPRRAIAGRSQNDIAVQGAAGNLNVSAVAGAAMVFRASVLSPPVKVRR